MPNENFVNLREDFDTVFPDGAASATESAMNLVFTADLLVKHIGNLLQPYNLSPSSALVLGLLADSETPLPPNEIASRLIITRATVTGLLDTLERYDYIQRAPHPTDRRKLLIALTEAGRQITEEWRPLVHQHQKEWFAVLDAGEQQQFVEFLHRLQGNLAEPD